MKKQYYLWQAALLMTGLFAGGCADETEGIALSGTPGEVIEFSVSRPQSRTIYLPEEGDGYAQIDWEGGEHIGIYCEQAPLRGVDQAIIEGEHDAEYIVNIPPHPDHDYHGDITANGNMLTWGTNEEGNDIEHIFYGAYPYDRINWDGSTFESPGTDNEKAIFSMKYITNQKCTIKESEEDFGRIEHYVAAPDMSNAYMMARKPMWRTKDHVLLDFDPIMTTLDITIEAGGYEVATGIIQPLTITGVSVFMPKSLGVEYFCYDAAKIRNEKDENGTLLDQTFGELTSELHDGVESIHVQFVDENGNKVNIPLSEGETINLMAFLPPIPDEYTDGTIIKIHTDENFNFVATLNGTLGAQHKIHIKLRDIKPDEPSNFNWITDLCTISTSTNYDERIYLSQLSIPGYECGSEEDPDDIEDLLEKGIRVFNINRLTTDNSGIHYRKLSSEIIEKFETYISNNNQEFIIVLIDGNNDYFLNDLDISTININAANWKTMPISTLKGKIIALEYRDGVVRGNGYVESHVGNYVADDLTFDKYGLTSNEDFNNVFPNVDWHMIYNKSVDDQIGLAKYMYETIVANDGQMSEDGRTGIIMVPNANKTILDDGQYTYSDLLIQAIVDCNYKLILSNN